MTDLSNEERILRPEERLQRCGRQSRVLSYLGKIVLVCKAVTAAVYCEDQLCWGLSGVSPVWGEEIRPQITSVELHIMVK